MTHRLHERGERLEQPQRRRGATAAAREPQRWQRLRESLKCCGACRLADVMRLGMLQKVAPPKPLATSMAAAEGQYSPLDRREVQRTGEAVSEGWRW